MKKNGIIKPELQEINKKFLIWMDIALSTGIAATKREFCEESGVSFTNIYNIQRGHQAVTLSQIKKAGELVGGDYNFIFRDRWQPLLSRGTKTGVELIEEGLTMIKQAKKKPK